MARRRIEHGRSPLLAPSLMSDEEKIRMCGTPFLISPGQPEMKLKAKSDQTRNRPLFGQKRQRQLLEKKKLADGDLFCLLTAHANG
jgi:hypothetical protein